MLSAIQDFVKDSFNEKEQSGLDTIRFGELRLWSEVGQFATLVAVIRGNPPEGLHEHIRDALLHVHRDYPAALEQFDGDSSRLAGIETQLRSCVELKQDDSSEGFPWLAAAAIVLVSAALGGWYYLSWQAEQRLLAYVSRLVAEPGILVTEQKVEDGHFHISGLRDPLSTDPRTLLTGTGIDPDLVRAQWQPFQSLDPEFVVKRLAASLTPPETVKLSVDNNRIVATGEASDTWIRRATEAALQLSAGGPIFDIAAVRDVSPETRAAERLQVYVARLQSGPGIIVTQQKVEDGQFYISGLRDPLSTDPRTLLTGTGIDPALVHAQWQPFQSLDPEFVLKRLTASLTPPETVKLSIDKDRIVATGAAPDTWIRRAAEAALQLSAGGPTFDISAVRDVSPETRAAERLQAYVARLQSEPGIIVTEQKVEDGQFRISGLRDPLSTDPRTLLTGTGIDPALLHEQWQPFQSLDPEFVLKRLTASLTPPETVKLSIDKDRIVATGAAPDTWITLAAEAARQLSAGGPTFDIAAVRDVSPQTRAAERWRAYVARLEAEPGIIITGQEVQDGQFQISGLRDPLSADPKTLLDASGIDPSLVHERWQPYQSLEPEFVLRRIPMSLALPETVQLSIDKDRIVAKGEAPDTWIARATETARQLSVGGPTFDISAVRDVSPETRTAERWRNYVARLEAEPGIIVTEHTVQGGKFRISGLRDPLSADPKALLSGTQIDPAVVEEQWQFYQSLDPEFVLKRLTASLNPPKSVQLGIIDDGIVAEGRAPVGWIKRARLAAQQLSADGLSFNLDKLAETTPQELVYLKNRIQAVDIFFEFGKAVPGAEQMPVLDILATMLKTFTADARKAGVTVRFTLTGHSDMKGRENTNLSISAARAETVRTLLKKRGVDPELILVRAAGTFEPAEAENVLTGSQANRRVSVEVNVE